MSNLEDIQMDIILGVQGLADLGAVEGAMNGVVETAGRVGTAEESMAIKTGRVSTIFGSFGQKLNNVERAYDAIFRAGLHMVMLGQQLTMVYQGGIGIIQNATTQWAGFETQLIKTSNAIGGITEGTPMWNALATAVEKTATALGVYDPTQVAEGVYYWEGATGQNIKTQNDLTAALSAMTPVLQMAYMKNIDMKTAIYGVEATMRMFHMTIKDTADVTAYWTDTVNRNALEMGDLVAAFKMVGPMAAAMGLSLQQVTDIIAGMADSGIRGSQAGQILRMELLKIEKPSTQASKALDKVFESTKGLGKSYNALVFPSGKFVGFQKYIDMLALATANMTDKQKGQLLATIGTAREVSGLVVAIDNAQRAQKGLGTATGATALTMKQAQADFATGWANVAKSWAFLTGAFHDAVLPILYAIGANAAQTLGPLITMATKFATVVATWVQNNPALVQMAEKIGGILLAAAGLAGAFFSVMGTLTLLAAGIGVVIQGFGSVILVFGVLGSIAAALIAAIASNIGGIRDAVMNFIGAMSGFFAALIGGNDKFKLSWNDVTSSVTKAINEVAPKVAAGLNTISGAIRDISNNKQAMDFIRTFGKYLLELLGISVAISGVTKVLKPFISLFSGLKSAIGGVASAVGWLFGGLSSVFKIASVLWNYLLVIAYAVVGALGLPVEAATAVAAAIAAVVALIVGYVTNIGGFRDKVNQFVSDVVANVGKFVAWFGTQIGVWWAYLVDQFGKGIAFLGTIPGQIGNFIGSVMKLIGDGIGWIVGQVVGFFQNIVNNFGYYLGYIIGFVVAWTAQFILHVAKWLADTGVSIIDWLGSLPGTFMTWLGQVTITFVNWVTKDFIPGIQKWIGDAIKSIVNFFIHLPDEIVGAVTPIVDMLSTFFSKLPVNIMNTLLDIGGQIVRGIWQGITNIGPWLSKQVGGFFAGMVQGIKDALHIKSPSQVMAEIGTNMVLGLAVGINGTDAAHKAMQDHTNQLIALARQGAMGATNALSAYGAGAMSFSTSADRTLKVQIDVTSSDGSVDKLKANDISTALQGSDLVRALTHMASVN